MSSAEEESQFHSGGLVQSPGGEDSVPVWIDFRCEHLFTRKQVERLSQEGSLAIALGSEGNHPGEG